MQSHTCMDYYLHTTTYLSNNSNICHYTSNPVIFKNTVEVCVHLGCPNHISFSLESDRINWDIHFEYKYKYLYKQRMQKNTKLIGICTRYLGGIRLYITVCLYLSPLITVNCFNM